MITMIVIFWLHFIADFLLQSDKMALNKSHSFKWLTIHALVYGIPFLLWFSFTHGIAFAILFAVLNAKLHWVVDAITSRLTSWLWRIGERHWFFVVIGLDQAIHMTCLLVTYRLIYDIILLWTLL